MNRRKFAGVLATLVIATILASMPYVGTAHGAPTTITAYKSTVAVNVNGAYSPSQWTDTATLNEPASGMTFAVKQNGTGWLFLLIWKQSAFYCSDTSCYGGIEIGNLSNTQPMGSPSLPTIMILVSPSFKGNVGEFIATGEQTPTTVTSLGYKTQTVCGLALSGTTYTAECYRSFKLSGASPYDFALGVGSTVEIAFSVGEFDNPGDHASTDMSTYVLTFSGSTYTASGTTSSSSGSSSSSTSSASSTSTTSSTRSSSSTTSASTSASTSTSSVSSSSSTASQSTSSTSTSSASVLTLATSSKNYTGTQQGVISGSVSGGASGTVTLSITNPAGRVVFSDIVALSSSGTFTDTFQPTVNNLWMSGTYIVEASFRTLIATASFSYSTAGAITSTTTVVSTVTSPTTVTSTFSVSGQSTTITQTATQTVTQTSTVTGPSSGIPDWEYAAIVVLLVVCFAVGFMAKDFAEANRNRPATRPVTAIAGGAERLDHIWTLLGKSSQGESQLHPHSLRWKHA